jgi:hypothetical protein
MPHTTSQLQVSYRYVEDFIQALAIGIQVGNRIERVKLASYDVGFLTSLYNQIVWDHRALTDRQAELLLKLIDKYSRQLRALGVDNGHVLDPNTREYRLGIRQVERTFTIERDGDDIVVRFPYVQRLIDYIRAGRRNLDGRCEWDPDRKVWRFGLTESTLSFVMVLATTEKFEVDPGLIELFTELGRVEEQGYRIELVESDDGYTITNAASSLQDYVNEHLGGFGRDNLIALADNAPMLGYDISQSLHERLCSEHDASFVRLLASHRNNVDPESISISDIYRYALATKRFPVLVYAPTPDEKTLDEILSGGIISGDQIFQSSRRGSNRFDPDQHLVYYTNVLDRISHVTAALKVSFQNMTFGANRLRWLNSPGKIVYYCTELIPRE